MLEKVPRSQGAQKNDNISFAVQGEEYTALMKLGVLYPAKVARAAVKSAASIAAMILASEAPVREVREKEKPVPRSTPGS